MIKYRTINEKLGDIIIFGPSGSAKTTLVSKLSKTLCRRAIIEDHEANPEIVKFQQELQFSPFKIQKHFLNVMSIQL